MKKIFCIVLLSVMLLMVGCSGSKTEAETESAEEPIAAAVASSSAPWQENCMKAIFIMKATNPPMETDG